MTKKWISWCVSSCQLHWIADLNNSLNEITRLHDDFWFSNFWDGSIQRCRQDFVIDFIKQCRWWKMFPISFVDNFDFRLENDTRLLASVRIRNWRSSHDDIFSWDHRRSPTKNMIHKDATQISTFKTSWSQDAKRPRPSNRIRSNEKMINRICSPTSRQYDWKYNLCCSVSSSSSYVLHFFSSDKLMSYTLFGYRLPFTFNFLLTLRSLSEPQNVDLSPKKILNWLHDVPSSENEVWYPIHEELCQYTVSSILDCSIQMILQMILFESYVLLERLEQLSFLRNYAYL